MGEYRKYDLEEVKEAVKISFSMRNVLRLLGRKVAGGNQTHLKNYIKKYNIDTSHFTGQGHYKGTISNRRKYAKDFLILGTIEDGRTNVALLRRSLDEIGRLYCCVKCGNNGNWNNEKLVLEVDHINEGYWDNREENLQYLCPNCHAQKTKLVNIKVKEVKIREKTERKKRISKSSKVNKKSEFKVNRQKIVDERIAILRSSDIDFSKFGWVQKSADLIGITPQNVRRFVTNNAPDLLENVFLRKN